MQPVETGLGFVIEETLEVSLPGILCGKIRRSLRVQESVLQCYELRYNAQGVLEVLTGLLLEFNCCTEPPEI